jgi:nicotinamidase-related amidase
MEASRFDGLDPRQIAVLLVDFQRDFCVSMDDRPMNTHSNAATAVHANGFAALASDLGSPVIYTQQVLDPARLTARQRPGAEHEALCRVGTSGAELFVTPLPGSVTIQKFRYDIWRAPDFESALNRLGVEALVVGGVELRCCVLYAVLGAEERGYRCFVAQDIVSGIDDDEAVPDVRHYLTIAHHAVPRAEDLLAEWPQAH